MLWAPLATLLPAALEPGAGVEYATIALTCMALGAVSDRLLPWPRALLAPAIAAPLALTADALAGTQLLTRSLLGPDPVLGVRFYGIGNVLKSGLAVLVFAAVAAALYPLDRRDAAGRRRAAVAMAGAGAVLAAIEGPARIGAGVGGVILVCAGAAVATVALLPGALTRRRALSVAIAPVVGLIVLAVVDLTTAHGKGQYTHSVLHARSVGALADLIGHRYASAWHELGHGAMPVATAVAVLAAGLGIYRRERLLAVVDGDPAWTAALAGGLTAGVVGALVEDSGPVLLVEAVFALACVLVYLWAGRVWAGRVTADRLGARHAPADCASAGAVPRDGVSAECPVLGSPSGIEVWDSSSRPLPADQQPSPDAPGSPALPRPSAASRTVNMN